MRPLAFFYPPASHSSIEISTRLNTEDRYSLELRHFEPETGEAGMYWFLWRHYWKGNLVNGVWVVKELSEQVLICGQDLLGAMWVVNDYMNSIKRESD